MELTNRDVESPRKIGVLLRSGRFLDCKAEHPILTDRGWIPAHDLTTDYAMACVAKVPQPANCVTVPHERWIGWMLGNGCLVSYASPSFVCSDPVLALDFISQTRSLFGLTPRPHRHRCKVVQQFDITAGPVRTSAGNPCKNWLREHDLWGRKAP